jgi:hypothetical protein
MASAVGKKKAKASMRRRRLKNMLAVTKNE